MPRLEKLHLVMGRRITVASELRYKLSKSSKYCMEKNSDTLFHEVSLFSSLSTSSLFLRHSIQFSSNSMEVLRCVMPKKTKYICKHEKNVRMTIF